MKLTNEQKKDALKRATLLVGHMHLHIGITTTVIADALHRERSQISQRKARSGKITPDEADIVFDVLKERYNWHLDYLSAAIVRERAKIAQAAKEAAKKHKPRKAVLELGIGSDDKD